MVGHLEAALKLVRQALIAGYAAGRDVAKSSDGGVEGHAEMSRSIRSDAGRILGCETRRGHDATIAGIEPGPPEAKSRRRGRPRIGEVREKPWLTAEPPMSERTWYRRQREQRKAPHHANDQMSEHEIRK